MLRHVLGDSVFFRAMRQYAQDPRFRFGTASTEDFQSVCETASGKSAGSLNYFFQEWIYGQNFPSYQYEWGELKNGSVYSVRVTLNQTTGTSNPNFFQMPIDFRFTGIGLDTTITVLNDTQNQTFRFDLPKEPTGFQLDPNSWILNNASGILVNVDQISDTPARFALLQNYPNPFNPSTLIPFDLPQAAYVRLEVYNELGELVQVLVDGKQMEPGHHIVQFAAVSKEGSPLSSGVYYYRLLASGVPVQTRKMVYLR